MKYPRSTHMELLVFLFNGIGHKVLPLLNISQVRLFQHRINIWHLHLCLLEEGKKMKWYLEHFNGKSLFCKRLQ